MTEKLVKRLQLLSSWHTYWDFLKHYVGGMYHRSDEHHIFLLAGGLAFSLFVCIVPLVLIIFSVVGIMLDKPIVADEINAFIDRVIPYQDYATFVKEKVFVRVDEFKLYKNLAGLIGLIGLFFASSGLFSSMRTVLNLVYRRTIKEHAVIGKLRDFGLVLLVLFYFVVATAILPTLEVFETFAESMKFFDKIGLGLIQHLAVSGVPVAIIFVAFFLLYYAVPHRRLPMKAVLVSAISAAALWEIAKQLFGIYIATVSLKNIYGAYVFMVVVVFWVYYTSLVFIVSAEIGQLFRERMKMRGSPVENPE